MTTKFIFSLSVITLLFYACSKDSEDMMDPNPPSGNCDTANMKYSTDILPILQTNCYPCHGATSNSGSGGIILEGHSNIKAKADAGILIGVITHASGFPPMPMDGPKLSDCNINKIRSWINNGTQDN